MGVFRYLGVFLVVFSQVAPEKHLNLFGRCNGVYVVAVERCFIFPM
jgi:hypothetical protein